jgi:hypothetical protein
MSRFIETVRGETAPAPHLFEERYPDRCRSHQQGGSLLCLDPTLVRTHSLCPDRRLPSRPDADETRDHRENANHEDHACAHSAPLLSGVASVPDLPTLGTRRQVLFVGSTVDLPTDNEQNQ